MKVPEIMSKLHQAGYKHIGDTVHAFLGGSHQHGAAIPGTVSDIDICGVYIEAPSEVLGVHKNEHFTAGTQDQYERNRPGDEDYKCYSLMRWANLACKGNPTVLGYLYTPCKIRGVWEDIIVPNKKLFQARNHGKAFLGYAQGQIGRLTGKSGLGKHGQRPELEVKFGYDTKAAMHLMRLMFEAMEYLDTGSITYPRPEKDLLLSIRQGAWTRDKLIAEYFRLEQEVKESMQKSSLPEQVDRERVSYLVSSCYIQHWRDTQKI